jgi:hypothetical protein
MCIIGMSYNKMTIPSLYYLTSFLFLLICSGISPEFIQAATAYLPLIQQNPQDKQLLLNGRVWRNQYSKAFGDQFFLTNSFLKGSVTFNGRRFNNLDLRYDIINDELILSIESYPLILMNKEMVDSFSLVFENRNYHIINAGNDTSNVLKGYVNILYDGPTTMYVKYTKKIQPMAVDGRYDLFVQEHRIYIRKGTEITPVRGKRKFLDILKDKKKEIRYYMKSNRLKFSRKVPDTFIPVLEFYDSIKK